MTHGLLDTNVLILSAQIDMANLPVTTLISSITLAELSAGPLHAIDPDERARRLAVLQRAESAYDPLPFDTEAARMFGPVSAAVLAAGRKPRGRVADLMIASIALANRLPLYTTNPDDFVGLDELVQVEAVEVTHTMSPKPVDGEPTEKPDPAGAVLGDLWRLMDLQEWDSLRRLLDPDLRVEYVHTGESFGRDTYVALNRDYPGAWRAEIVDLVAGGSQAAACVRVTDGSETHYVASFSTIEGGLITKLVEVWAESGVEVPADRRPDSV